MTREQAKKLLPILQAFSDGKIIQFKHAEDNCDYWKDIEFPGFQGHYEYRIKPEPRTFKLVVSKEPNGTRPFIYDSIEGHYDLRYWEIIEVKEIL